MYKSKSLWDQEQDKYDNHTGEVTGDYHAAGKYDKNQDYTSDDKSNEDYTKKEEQEGKKEEEKSEFEKQVDDNLPQKKYDKKEEDGEVVRKKAAEEINRGIQEEKTKINKTRHHEMERNFS